MTHRLTRTTPLLAAALGCAALMAPAVAEARPVLVELFTSQGCSACPPADAYLGELAEQDGIVALSYNIDYWDYLGWEDTLGRAEHTARQQAYALRFKDRKYTPQMVIDGASHMAGNRPAKVALAVHARQEDVETDPELTWETGHDAVTLHLPAHPASSANGEATVWLVLFDRKTEIAIKRGENAGETITYTNAVRELTPVGIWNMAEPLAMQIGMPMLREGGHDGAAVIVQEGHAGPVINAALIDVATASAGN